VSNRTNAVRHENPQAPSDPPEEALGDAYIAEPTEARPV
jgi:hypothetical protein